MRSKLIWSLVAGFTLMMAGLAIAQTNTATPPEVNPPSSTPGVGTGSENKGLNTAETKAADQAKSELEAIRTRSKTLSAKEIEASEPKIDAAIEKVNAEAAKEGSKVPDRLAKQLGMTTDALAAEKAKFGTGFGGLMIAHLLLSNEKSTSTVTLDDLFKMHEEGMGWGQIAHGMGLKLGGLVSAVNSEGRVATGNGKVDTKTPRIGSESEHAAMGSKGAAGAMGTKGAASTMEHGKSATVPSHEMGGAPVAGHGK